MPRIRSLLDSVKVDHALRAHTCKGNSRHRIAKGDKRLKVRNGRTWDHYCIECGKRIASRDIDKLESLVGEL